MSRSELTRVRKRLERLADAAVETESLGQLDRINLEAMRLMRWIEELESKMEAGR